ncbi:MBL fold metallo-hydrolase [Candidatus Collierbacteria bacterium CG_4_10_14_0_8_um_filter_43_86]|uniref:MBL fold metallo-hydrolase n=1 Tax=Candidatus Collierbacteria bacterium CG_4_9_14_3_um_filter_43_16 TaxID=1974532 RepID=A0A2M8BUL0_9BACT|nr:MAG: MBL fold metallo-hydrolase [Candidatus Collierbacteria bacterium CG_4_10_14_0_8_um_filter_43_86]PJB47554.1 MAG: MBL fold metallo-hydrolase [Candidatus Collierbacteria bacterium CG_4_9_14_3_um_filter_43_16]
MTGRCLWYYCFMEITYFGHSCFKLKSKGGLVIYLDPFKSEMVGIPLLKDVADVVTVSHPHEDHSSLDVITGPISRPSTFVIDREGEYEIAGVQISAMKTFHDKNNGADRGKNLIMFIVMDGMHILHLGDICHKLSESQIEKVGSVDALMIPVGGTFTLDANEAMEMIKEIQPSYAIPMHFKTATSKILELTTLENFLEKNKFPVSGESLHKIKLDEGSLPDDTQILLMNG